MSEKIYIGCDDAAVEYKEAIKELLVRLGYEPVDLGVADASDHTYYPYIAARLAKLIQVEPQERRGILICGTGAGMAVVANKYRGVYAVACESVYAAEKCRAINDANVMTMGGWIVAPELGVAMVDKFLDTGFTDNLEEWRRDFLKNARVKVANLEETIYK